MLVLSRRPEEEVVIGTGPHAIRVRVLSVENNQVKLGFVAPSHIDIHREEIYNKIQAKAEAA